MIGGTGTKDKVGLCTIIIISESEQKHFIWKKIYTSSAGFFSVSLVVFGNLNI